MATKIIVECTGLRDASGKTPRHEFDSRREADKWAEWGHCCLAWHRFFTVETEAPHA